MTDYAGLAKRLREARDNNGWPASPMSRLLDDAAYHLDRLSPTVPVDEEARMDEIWRTLLHTPEIQPADIVRAFAKAYAADYARRQRDVTTQKCIDAITAEGIRVQEGSNESWRQGMFHAAEILRALKGSGK